MSRYDWKALGRNHFRLDAPYPLAKQGERSATGPLPVFATTMERVESMTLGLADGSTLALGLRRFSFVFVAVHGIRADGHVFRVSDRMGLN